MTSADDAAPEETPAGKARREGAVSKGAVSKGAVSNGTSEGKTSGAKASGGKAGAKASGTRTATTTPAAGKSAGRSTSGRAASGRSAGTTSGRTTPGRTTPGRATPRAEAPSGRYTPPIPNYKKQSPPWFPWTMLAIFLVGLVVIVVNYAQVFWNPASNWALAGGLFCILAGAVMATQWR